MSGEGCVSTGQWSERVRRSLHLLVYPKELYRSRPPWPAVDRGGTFARVEREQRVEQRGLASVGRAAHCHLGQRQSVPPAQLGERGGVVGRGLEDVADEGVGLRSSSARYGSLVVAAAHPSKREGRDVLTHLRASREFKWHAVLWGELLNCACGCGSLPRMVVKKAKPWDDPSI